MQTQSRYLTAWPQVLRNWFSHPGIEATVEQSNKLLMHYGCHTVLGTELQPLLYLLVADLGLSFQPFWVPYEHCRKWVTTCWLKESGRRSTIMALSCWYTIYWWLFLRRGMTGWWHGLLLWGVQRKNSRALTEYRNTSRCYSCPTFWGLVAEQWTSNTYRNNEEENFGHPWNSLMRMLRNQRWDSGTKP